MSTLSILLPVRNEGANLKMMIGVLQAVIEVPKEIIVICDSPDDDSIEVVASLSAKYSNLKLVQNTLGAGVKNAIRAGVNSATGEYVLILVADEIAPIIAVENFLALMDKGCDFVSGTRYAHGGRRLGGSRLGHSLSCFGNKLFSWLTSCPFTDATTGIKMFRRSVFSKFALQGPAVGWTVAFEMAVEASLLGLKLGEVPIISVDRLYGGKSTFRPWTWTKAYARYFVWALQQYYFSPTTRTSAEVIRL